jgi:hypothetical protein
MQQLAPNQLIQHFISISDIRFVNHMVGFKCSLGLPWLVEVLGSVDEPHMSNSTSTVTSSPSITTCNKDACLT